MEKLPEIHFFYILFQFKLILFQVTKSFFNGFSFNYNNPAS